MKIELSDSLKAWIEQQTAFRGFATSDAFVESVVQTAKARLQKTIDAALLEGLDSGDPIEVTPEFWEEQRRQLDEYARVLIGGRLMRSLVIGPQAARDALKHAKYLALNASPAVARRFQKALAAAITRLRRMPGLGSPHESDNPRLAGLCVWPVPRFENYLIFYRADDECVAIVRVFHASQDYGSKLEEA